MCFNPELKSDLENQLVEIKAELKAKIAAHQTACAASEAVRYAGVPAELTQLFSDERRVIKEIAAIPHKFEVGEGAHNGFNGDRYPYKVVSVSKSGLTVKMVRMGHRAAQKGLPTGHQDWEVYDLPEDQTEEITVTFRKKTGSWAQKGSTSNRAWSNFMQGARYSYNWEF